MRLMNSDFIIFYKRSLVVFIPASFCRASFSILREVLIAGARSSRSYSFAALVGTVKKVSRLVLRREWQDLRLTECFLRNHLLSCSRGFEDFSCYLLYLFVSLFCSYNFLLNCFFCIFGFVWRFDVCNRR